MLPALSAQYVEEAAPVYRHKKTGGLYKVLGVGRMQAEKWYEPDGDGAATVDMREVVVYRSLQDGLLWVRPRQDFEDGRFEAVDTLES